MITALHLWILRLKLRLLDREIASAVDDADDAYLCLDIGSAQDFDYYAQELRAERVLLKARICQLSTNAKKGKQS